MEEKTNNTLSEDQVLEVIMQYANSEVDYAIMLDGPWGSGKSYFVQNRLEKELANRKYGKESKITYVYRSLNGIKNVEQFRNELYSCIVAQFSGTFQKASNIAGLIMDITSGSNEQVSFLLKSANKAFKYRERSIINEKLSSNLFIVIDDFERYEGNDYK